MVLPEPATGVMSRGWGWPLFALGEWQATNLGPLLHQKRAAAGAEHCSLCASDWNAAHAGFAGEGERKACFGSLLFTHFFLFLNV